MDRPSTVDSHRFVLPRTRSAGGDPTGAVEKLATDHRATAWATGLGQPTDHGRPRPGREGSRPAHRAGMSAVDLDGDGYLDVIGSVHDARGVNYWLTFGWDGRLVTTGCAPEPAGAAMPTHLLGGFCPTTVT